MCVCLKLKAKRQSQSFNEPRHVKLIVPLPYYTQCHEEVKQGQEVVFILFCIRNIVRMNKADDYHYFVMHQ